MNLRSLPLVFIFRSVSAGAGFIATAVVARSLGPNDAGAFFLWISVLQIGAVLQKAGVHVIVLRRLSTCSERDIAQATYSLFRDSNIVNSCVSGVVAVAFLAVLATIKVAGEQVNDHVVLGFAAFLVGWFVARSSIFIEYYRATDRPTTYIGLGFFFVSLLQLTFVASISLLGGKDPKVFFFAYSSTYMLLYALCIGLLWRRVSRDGTPLSRPLNLAKESSPYVLADISDTALLWTGPLLIGVFFSLAELAYFRVSLRLCFLLLFVSSATTAVFSRSYARLWGLRDRTALRRLLVNTLFGSGILALLTASGLASITSPLCAFLGDEYGSVENVVFFMLPYFAVSAMFGSFVGLVAMLGGGQRIWMVNLVGTLVFVLGVISGLDFYALSSLFAGLIAVRSLFFAVVAIGKIGKC